MELKTAGLKVLMTELHLVVLMACTLEIRMAAMLENDRGSLLGHWKVVSLEVGWAEVMANCLANKYTAKSG
jgi:hypothetical protein